MAALVSHTLIVLALIGTYVALTLRGADATAVLGLLGGYIAGAGTQAATRKVSKGG